MDIDEKKEQRTKTNKKARIIIRNLSFKATEDLVRKHFEPYGELQDIKLLRKPDGQLVGCGFIQYNKVPFAAKAIKECNAKPFLGRPIAVDWAVPKSLYISADIKVGNTNSKETNEINDINNHSPMQQSENDSINDNDEDNNETEDCNEEEEDSNGSNELEGNDHDGKSNGKNLKWKGRAENPDRTSDVNEGKTVFIRNLDFSTTQEALEDYVKQFGSVHYALLCMDKIMERPKGTAFVKFQDPESAQKCIEASKSGTIQLDGRTLDVVLALTPQDLDRQKSETKKEHKDKRNLYLAREGLIRPGTRAAIGVSSSDMAKRQQNELWKRQMLQNLHMFISRERLCVHNLPNRFTDKQLKNLFLKHSPKGAKITEAKIMRNLKTLDDNNKPVSKGYGFVTFTKHEDALTALRNLNNNPNIFSNDKRPIVEFSIENRAAIQAKMERNKKSQEKMQNLKNKGSELNETISHTVPDFSGTIADPKVKGLPSHMGPKIRHKKRVNPDGLTAKKPKITRKMLRNPLGRKRQAGKRDTTEQPKPKKKKMTKTGSRNKFDSMVDAYQKSINSSSTSNEKKKWFDS